MSWLQEAVTLLKRIDELPLPTDVFSELNGADIHLISNDEVAEALITATAELLRQNLCTGNSFRDMEEMRRLRLDGYWCVPQGVTNASVTTDRGIIYF